MEKELIEQIPTFDGEIYAEIKSVGEIETNINIVKSFAMSLKEYYSNIIFDENSMKIAKTEKANVNKFKEEVAEYRKNIIKQWKEPVLQFENLAKETETILTEVYLIINNQCNNYDNAKKQEKEQNLRDFFEEYCKSYEIDFISFENVRT